MKRHKLRKPRSRSLPGPFAAHLFADWLASNGHRFLVQPYLTRVRRRGADIAFVGAASNVRAYLCCDKWGGLPGIDIYAEYRGRYWDSLGYMETSPVQQSGTYVCGLSDPNERDLYSSREALWIGEVFEPFLAWCNKRLPSARWVCLYKIKHGSWAALSSAEEPLDETEGTGKAIYLPVWRPDHVLRRSGASGG